MPSKNARSKECRRPPRVYPPESEEWLFQNSPIVGVTLLRGWRNNSRHWMLTARRMAEAARAQRRRAEVLEKSLTAKDEELSGAIARLISLEVEANRVTEHDILLRERYGAAHLESMEGLVDRLYRHGREANRRAEKEREMMAIIERDSEAKDRKIAELEQKIRDGIYWAKRAEPRRILIRQLHGPF